MKTLIVYDKTGYVLMTQKGEPTPREPIGVPFLWVDIPEGKQLKTTDGFGVDVSVTPHQAILEDIPPTELEIQQELINTLGKEITDIKLQLLLGGM